MKAVIDDFSTLKTALEGELQTDKLSRIIYATDASVYRKVPIAVAYPKHTQDIQKLIRFATKNGQTLIPRATGTSLAGQCVGEGIVVDISKYFTNIINIDIENRTATVQPGVIRDVLNQKLQSHGLFFGPNTSTSNRCTIGGMVGNNSSGYTSIKYGVTRDKVIALKALLSDGSEVIFQSLSKVDFLKKTEEQTLEGAIYKKLHEELSNPENQKEIEHQFPKPSIHRRNNGYAIDALLHSSLFMEDEEDINVAKLICGSEGTLVFVTEITLRLDPLPPTEKAVVAAHFSSINESLKAVVTAMQHDLYMCELLDKTILDCTQQNRSQRANRFFIDGDPKAILIMELATETATQTRQLANDLITSLQKEGLGYAFPVLYDEDIDKITELRKAGLGLLGNIVGDKKSVPCIEDTAVHFSELPEYIEEFSKIMDDFGQEAVYYAHAGAGELHLRPILNLKKSEDVRLFREITTRTAKLVKKYGGSFSGEHGDGIVRAEFIPLMIGQRNYELLKRIKQTFDPNYIFNKGKIIDPLPMDDNLRYQPDRQEPKIKTVMDFSDSQGILRATEKCNGSGDCRKPIEIGGGMCPSFRATRNEKDTTRARANALREILTQSNHENKFNNKALLNVFDLCISCKACAFECPSNVDVATLKAEFLHQYYQSNPRLLRSKIFIYSDKLNRFGQWFPQLTNAITNTKAIKQILHIAPQRNLPKLTHQTFMQWYKKHKTTVVNPIKTVYLFVDEFTNRYDLAIGVASYQLLTKLQYEVSVVLNVESGRASISKGDLTYAKQKANANIACFKDKITPETPLIGIEPSAILTFRDEYLRLADDKQAAQNVANYTFTFEEFFADEIQKGNITSESFTSEQKTIRIHTHCHQKALSNTHAGFVALSLPKNYTVTLISSGCCGMAGSFGYEAEHYQTSITIGENDLLPKIRKTDKETVIVASGTSCRHQIKDNTDRQGKHPAVVLYEALL